MWQAKLGPCLCLWECLYKRAVQSCLLHSLFLIYFLMDISSLSESIMGKNIGFFFLNTLRPKSAIDMYPSAKRRVSLHPGISFIWVLFYVTNGRSLKWRNTNDWKDTGQYPPPATSQHTISWTVACGQALLAIRANTRERAARPRGTEPLSRLLSRASRASTFHDWRTCSQAMG